MILGSSSGGILSLVPPPSPAWLSKLELGEQFFDQPVPFEPQWIVLEGGLGLQIRALADPPRSPSFEAVSSSDLIEAWARSIITAHDAGAQPSACREIWAEYVARAVG